MEPLKAGAMAPDFIAKTLIGTEIRLGSLRGKKIWLSFYRYAKCPICNLYLHKIAAKLDFLSERGVEVICVFESPVERFPKYFAGKQMPFIMIPDETKELYRLYGVESRVSAALHPTPFLQWFEAIAKGFVQPLPDGAFGQIPAHFLIDELGKVRTAHYGKHIGEHIAWEKVEAFAGTRKVTQPSSSQV